VRSLRRAAGAADFADLPPVKNATIFFQRVSSSGLRGELSERRERLLLLPSEELRELPSPERLEPPRRERRRGPCEDDWRGFSEV